MSETDERGLGDERRKPFRRGGVDSFVMAVRRPLGNLSHLRVWHDNSAKGDMASWFLKCIIVHDLQTREKFYFICEKWLAVEKGDGAIERVLPVCGQKQKTELRYLIQRQTKYKFSDEHLWFSVFARPAQSSFTRLDRVTCCFVLLYITMLMNIMYYGMQSTAKTSGLQIGPLYLSMEQVSILDLLLNFDFRFPSSNDNNNNLQTLLVFLVQISIGVITNLITFPPCFLLVTLFRRSRHRVPHLSKIKKALSQSVDKEKSHSSPRE
jgi:hypothetical protein